MTCPSCNRPIAVARPHCLYCGAALPEDAVAALTPQAVDAPVATTDRALVILDLTGADPAAVARALALPAFEAGQRVRRGPQLHRVCPAAEAQDEAARLQQEGLVAILVSEAATRQAAPLLARGGHRSGHTILVQAAEGEIAVSGEELVLAVRGPIAREYQAAAPPGGVLEQMRSFKRLRMATLEQGYRYHLHRRDDPRPLELNPNAFDFGSHGAAGGSTLLALAAWVEDLCRDVPQDDGFRWLLPALAVSTEATGLTGAMRSRDPGAGRAGGNAILDNAAQFRFYSAWRGILERHRRRSAG